MNKVTWEYLAGFTDGEGYIGVPGRGPVIIWGQKDKNILDHIFSFLKEQGLHPHLNLRKAKPESRRPNDIYILSLSRRKDVLRALDILEPFMILKPPQCKNVRIWLKENPAHQNYDELEIEQIKKWAEEGYSASWIGRQLNCECQKIYKFASRKGIRFHGAGGKFINGKRQNPMSKEEYRKHCNEKEKLKYCVDCGEKTYRYSERCNSCAVKYRHLTKPESFKTLNIGSAQYATNP